MIKLQFDQNTSQNIWDQYGNVIRYDLQEAMQSSKLNDMFELFFPNYFEIHDKCKVSFLSPKEMKCHENRRNDVEVRKNAVALIEKILATCDEKFFLRKI